MKSQQQCGDVARSLWLNAAVFSKHLDNSLGAVHGIGLTEYMVLHSLMQAPNQVLRRIDIAEALARTASGVTRLLMPMEKTGLVTKEAKARDARVSLVKITPAGEELFRNATTSLNARAETLLRNLEGGQGATLLELLKRV